MPVPLWGTAAENEKVTVRFQDQEVTTTAHNGKWLVRLQNLQAGGPFQMTIAGTNPLRTSGYPNRASGTAIARSHTVTKPAPPATAGPFTAAMVGLGNV